MHRLIMTLFLLLLSCSEIKNCDNVASFDIIFKKKDSDVHKYYSNFFQNYFCYHDKIIDLLKNSDSEYDIYKALGILCYIPEIKGNEILQIVDTLKKADENVVNDYLVTALRNDQSKEGENFLYNLIRKNSLLKEEARLSLHYRRAEKLNNILHEYNLPLFLKTEKTKEFSNSYFSKNRQGILDAIFRYQKIDAPIIVVEGLKSYIFIDDKWYLLDNAVLHSKNYFFDFENAIYIDNYVLLELKTIYYHADYILEQIDNYWYVKQCIQTIVK